MFVSLYFATVRLELLSNWRVDAVNEVKDVVGLLEEWAGEGIMKQGLVGFVTFLSLYLCSMG